MAFRPIAFGTCYCWRPTFTQVPTFAPAYIRRTITTGETPSSKTSPRFKIPFYPEDIHPTRRTKPGSFHGNIKLPPPKKIPAHPPPGRAAVKDPMGKLTAAAIHNLDPNGTRLRLLSRTKDGLRVGDIVQVWFKNHEPFSGVLINLRRRGIDSALLLRNQLTRVGVEMWVKIFSPNIVRIDLVQRAKERARRARLYYLRKPEHDRGSVQGIVDQYVKQRTLLRSGFKKTGDGAGGGAGAGRFGGNKIGGKGKK